MKILLYNISHCMGVQGSLREYFLHAYRYVYTPKFIRQKNANEIAALTTLSNVDVCCFVEESVKSNYIPCLTNCFPHSTVLNKFSPTHPFQHLPIGKNKGIGIHSRNNFEIVRHWFPAGLKRLLIEARYENGLSIFLGHFSVGLRSRAAQIAFCADLLRGRKKAILCGDFNIFSGMEEIRPLLQAGLVLANEPNKYTFPTYKPSMSLDLFFCTPDLAINSVAVLQNQANSDHLPVIMDVTC